MCTFISVKKDSLLVSYRTVQLQTMLALSWFFCYVDTLTSIYDLICQHSRHYRNIFTSLASECYSVQESYYLLSAWSQVEYTVVLCYHVVHTREPRNILEDRALSLQPPIVDMDSKLFTADYFSMKKIRKC